MIRHFCGGRLLAEPVLPLPRTMIQAAFPASLIPAIGTAPMLKAGLPAAVLAAVAMAAITVRADEEDGVAVLPATGPQQENAFAVNCSRHRSLAVLDNGSLAMSG
jgi:hypothetical protein